MAYKVGVTWRHCATSHSREEVVVEDLDGIGRAITEDAPANWNVCYAVIVETTAAPQVLEPAVTLGEKSTEKRSEHHA